MYSKLERKRWMARDAAGNIVMTIKAASLVSAPAIDKNYALFSRVNLLNFSVNDEKMEITGPAMIPNMDILRQDGKEMFYCYFTESDVEDFAEEFLSSTNHLQANFEHGDNYTSDLRIKESWIVRDPEEDASKALGFKDVVSGTWFITYKTRNVELWNEIKNSSLSGFSVELDFPQEKDDSQTKNENEMSKLKFMDSVTTDGTNIQAETFEVGKEMFVVAEDGTTTPAPTGDYTLEDGSTVRVVDGVITEVVAAMDPAAEADVENEMSKFAAEVSAKLTDFEARIFKLEESLSAANTKAADMEKINADLSKKVEEFSKLPGTSSITSAKRATDPTPKMSFQDQIEHIRSFTK